jgi:hypothetical protein
MTSEAFLPRELGVRLNPSKTILQPVARGVDFVGHVIKPHSRTARRRTVRVAIDRISRMEGEDLYRSANSYFGLFRQSPQSHMDRTRLANVLRSRGHSIDKHFTKTYRTKEVMS